MLPEIEKLTRKLSEVAQGQKDIHALCRGMVMDEVAKDSFDEIMMSDAFVAEKGDKNAALARYIDKRTKLYKAEFMKWNRDQEELRKRTAAQETQRKQLQEVQRVKDKKREVAELKREQQRKMGIKFEMERPYNDANNDSIFYRYTAIAFFIGCGVLLFGIADGTLYVPFFLLIGLMAGLFFTVLAVNKRKQADKEKAKLELVGHKW